jgi:hypothetical protein
MEETMQNERVCDAYKKLYDHRSDPDNPLYSHNNPDLLARWGANPMTLETQIMCHKGGTPLDNGKFEENGEIFGPQRWPYDAGGDANYNNPRIQYIIRNRMKAIGTTWWDWQNKRSIGLGYDFDSIMGHADGVGVSDEELAKLDCIETEWLEVIRSTGGRGRHIYIWFQEPFPITENHHEHAALARAYIPLIAKYTGLDIEASVDVCGSVMWIHHEKADAESRGYEVIKPAIQTLDRRHVPPNWKDHLEVVSGGRSKVRVQGWTADGVQTSGDELDEMTEAFARVELEEIHMNVLEALENTGHSSVWVHDHHLWQGHTRGLMEVFDEFKERGHPLKGLFATNSLDTDPGKPNCFMRPRQGGGWDVYRFGHGVEECELWDTQGKWTHIQYNCEPSLRQVSLACGGFEAPDAKMGYIFSELAELNQALAMLGSKIRPPTLKDKDGNELKDGYAKRQLSLREDESQRIILCIQKKAEDDTNQFKYFTKSPRGWERLISDAIELAGEDEEQLFNELDNKIRALKVVGASEEQFECWVVRDADNSWVTNPRENVKSVLMMEGHQKPDPILGQAVFKPWKVVNLPFQPEYPGGRRWNRDGIQFAFTPLEIKDGSIPVHRHWDIILNHSGRDLDEYIPHLHWAKDWGIVKGGDYLKAWIACMFRFPECKLPYLFMYGVQNSGKSTIHEAIAKLLVNEKGVARADRAMTSVNGYNGELMGAILAVVDEIDVANSGPDAYNRLKDWTTGTSIAIHAKHKTVIQVPNTLHFMQFGNSRDNLPVFQGDTRITAMCVEAPEQDIPKDQLFEKLMEEAPAFLRTLLDMEIPEAIGRLRLPIIETRGKLDLMESNKDLFQTFIEERCFQTPGSRVKLADFKKVFYTDMDDVNKSIFTESVLRKRLSEAGFPVGRSAGNVTCIGNLTFDDTEKASEPFIQSGKRIAREDEV